MKKIISLTVLITVSVLAVFLLYYISRTGIPANGFDRRFPNDFNRAVFKAFDSLAIDTDYYLAGGSEDTVYLGSRTRSKLYALQWQTKTINSIDLNTKELKGSLRFSFHEPFVFITSPASSQVFVTSVNEKIAPVLLSQGRMIADYVAAGTRNLIIKTWNDDRTELELAYLSHAKFKLNPSVLEKQIDGKFCTDGRLLYNRELAVVIYVYFYRNQWIITDSLLSHVSRHATIDTISRARISVSPIKSEHSESLSTPARITNQFMTTSENHLLIQSILKADNESSAIVKNYSAVDVYHLPEGIYSGSFYIPFHHGEALREFQLDGKNLTIRYRHLLVTGPLPPPVLDHE